MLSYIAMYKNKINNLIDVPKEYHLIYHLMTLVFLKTYQ